KLAVHVTVGRTGGIFADLRRRPFSHGRPHRRPAWSGLRGSRLVRRECTLENLGAKMVSATVAALALAFWRNNRSWRGSASSSSRCGKTLDIPRPGRDRRDLDRAAALSRRRQNRAERRRSVSVALVQASGPFLFQQAAVDRD